MTGKYGKTARSGFITVLALGLAGGMALAQRGVRTAAPSTMMMAKTASIGLVNINTATKAQLSALPGIGDVYAQKIIDGRPYGTKTELTSRRILPVSTYTKIRGMIVASRPGTRSTSPQKPPKN